MEIGPLVIKFCRLALGGPVIITHRVHASARRVHTAAIFCVLFKLEDRKKFHMLDQDPGPGDFFDTNADTRSVCGT